MIPCTGCSRFIQSDAHRCPFCDTIQRAAPSPLRPAVTSMILGLTLSACGTPSTGDEGASASETMGPTSAATMDGSEATSVSSMSGTSASTSTMSTSTMSSVGDTEGEAAVTAYGGPDVDTSPPQEDTAGTIGDGTTATGTGTTATGTGTGTGSTGQ